MIADCFHETPADGLTGAIMFVEGIEDAAVLLNGPTGCKFYHGAICESQMPRIDALDPLRYSEEFYFGQPRVPATYLDGSDYVFGATGKLEKILDRIAASKDHAFIAVVNSPGAALIGDDLERFLAEAKLPVPCAAVENPGFSTSFADGFFKAALATIRGVRPVRNIRQPKVVNLIGTSLYDRNWEGNIVELKKLLDLCGVKINAVLSAGTSIESFRQLGRATLNVCIQAELAEPLGTHLESEYGTPLLLPSKGAPIGFDATESLITEVCSALGAENKKAMTAISHARQRAYKSISRFHTITGLPKGATFALKAWPSVALPLCRWLYEYLGMIPIAIYSDLDVSTYGDKLVSFLKHINAESALNPSHITDPPQVALASGAVLARLAALKWAGAGIELSLPSGSSIDVVPKPIMGATGSLYLIEQLLNGMNS